MVEYTNIFRNLSGTVEDQGKIGKALFMKRGRLLGKTKRGPCQECPGAEHIGWVHPNHFPSIPNNFPCILIGFLYNSIHFIYFFYTSLFPHNCSLLFAYFCLFLPKTIGSQGPRNAAAPYLALSNHFETIALWFIIQTHKTHFL